MAPAMLVAFALYASLVRAEPYNTFDGPGFPACNNVSTVYKPTTVDETITLVRTAAQNGTPVRASGKGHMWYDTMCSDNPSTVIIRTENLNRITDLSLPPGAQDGSVMIEAGVTFFQLAEYLHANNASMGYTLVNWNITLAGSIAMGAHRSSLREDSMVAAGALELHIIDGNGQLRVVKRSNSDEWLAASTSLGLLGVIAKVKFKIYPDFKVYAKQDILEEKAVLDGDIYGMIVPYGTANFWWWPYLRKFHLRYYDPVPAGFSDQEGFQSTFSVTKAEADIAAGLLNSGKILPTSNMAAETLFFSLWSAPNFRDKRTDTAITTWPVYGWNYDVLIGGLYPGYGTQWDYGLRGETLELAFPIPLANAVLKRVRQAFDAELAKGIVMTSTYRSGINIKFGKAYEDLLGQVSTGTADGADWTKGAMMFDFPTFKPNWGDGKRFNEEFYGRLARDLIATFPCRPHWTKNTREVFEVTVANGKLDPSRLARFKSVRQQFDPKGMFKSVVGEILGLY
ncbi:FAD/FMN-containing dehydrogenase [Paraphoma chrysanthemicola]|uniref:FAD/FMN-containing dehydrogenase n=1 Tax=Paraphoma chrysanthemicola TaxID=798071 RepID=A0A8K0W3A2_9PLEO|nr:FAD/FMN-containing dehydrogenase [Paraphoma chrysanthemicola]